ncbi:MAG TPA: hypothetical protein VK789_20965 [Bryobacteraceae bacterium]|nr:hypothetical protein [Bryobacteraceae bacterium]
MRTAVFLLMLAGLSPMYSAGQQSDASKEQAPPKHVLWIIPNFRTSRMLQPYVGLTAKQKFTIAAQDTFDRGTIALGAVFAAEGQFTDANHSFGQGVEGYAHYFATSYADFAIGNYMTEGVFPSLLHQDPRYFRLGSGGGRRRLEHAIGQIFVTHTDSGGTQFNYSEIAGNSAAVAISMAYYPENRRVTDAVSKLGIQIAVDAAANLVKEFWPEKRGSRKAPRSDH